MSTTDKLTHEQCADKVWHCKSCHHVEKAEDPYQPGDSEPCIHCEDGVARVYDAGGFDPDFHNKVVAATKIPRKYLPLNFEDVKPKSRPGVDVIQEIEPGMVYVAGEPEFMGKVQVRKDLHVLPRHKSSEKQSAEDIALQTDRQMAAEIAEELEASDNVVIKDYVRRSKKDG